MPAGAVSLTSGQRYLSGFSRRSNVGLEESFCCVERHVVSETTPVTRASGNRRPPGRWNTWLRRQRSGNGSY